MQSDACLNLKTDSSPFDLSNAGIDQATQELLCAARPSNLSKSQVVEVEAMLKHFYPHLRLKPLYLKSQGDIDKTTSLRALDRTNFFTDTLDAALLQGQARLAVHSAKDLPKELAEGLFLAAVTSCLDARDALILGPHIDLSKPLPEGLRIATSSTHREKAAAMVAPHPQFQDLRGTIEERLAVVKRGEADGVVLAWVALMRLKLTHLPHLFLPGSTTAGQGSLALVVRKADRELIELLTKLDTRINRPQCHYLGIDPSSYASPFKLIHSPAIDTQSLMDESPELQQTFLQAYEKASHLLLTSPRSARYIWQLIEQDPRWLELAKEKTWICIGPSTAKGLGPEAHTLEVAAPGSSAEALIPLLEKFKKSFILYPHSRQARPFLQQALNSLGIKYLALEIYQTVPKAIERIERLLVADELIVTSPSCVHSLYSQITPSSFTKVTAIGSITELTLQKYQDSR